MSWPAVELVDITKRFGDVVACNGATLTVDAGSVHALLGQNGAGKTSLVNVLSGTYAPDEGAVRVSGTEHTFRSPADALAAGVAMIHQEFRLVDSLTVAQNVVLGAQHTFRLGGDVNRRVGELAERHGLTVDPAAPVWRLSVGERQRVEIAKALWRDATVLVLDEPTAVLTPTEAEALSETLAAMSSQGRAVIYISHKLDEVLAVCDAATVLRGGRTVARIDDLAHTSRAELVELMIGSDSPVVAASVIAGDDAPRGPQPSADRAAAERARTSASAPVLELVGVTVLGDSSLTAVDDVTLTVGAGEMVGIAGVAGNGQVELADAAARLRPLAAGTVSLAGTDVTSATAREVAALGLAYVPEDRRHVGLAPSMSVTDNAVLRSYRQHRRAGWLSRARCRADAARLADDFDIAVGGLDEPTAALSGGNLQKLLVGRELSTQPVAIIAAQPTRGLDVAAVESITGLLAAQARAGAAVLVISEDVDELLALCDRVVVMFEGQLTAEFDPASASRYDVSEAMAALR